MPTCLNRIGTGHRPYPSGGQGGGMIGGIEGDIGGRACARPTRRRTATRGRPRSVRAGRSDRGKLCEGMSAAPTRGRPYRASRASETTALDPQIPNPGQEGALPRACGPARGRASDCREEETGGRGCLKSRCADAPMRRCADAPMRRCADAPMRRCADAPMIRRLTTGRK